MSSPYVPIFPAGIDPLIALDSSYQSSGGFDANDRMRIALQIQALQRFLLGITNGAYGGIYTSTQVGLVLTTSLTSYQLSFDSSLPVGNAEIRSGSSIAILASGPLRVTSTISFHTGTTATQVVLRLFKNGVALADCARSSNTGSTSAFVNITLDTIQQTSIGDVYTVWAFATTSGVTLTYAASLLVETPNGRMGTIGLPGQNGAPGQGIGTPYSIAYVNSPYPVPSVSADVEMDTSGGDITNTIVNGTADRQQQTFRIVKGSNKGILSAAANNLVLQSNVGVPTGLFKFEGIGNFQTITWSAAQSAWFG